MPSHNKFPRAPLWCALSLALGLAVVSPQADAAGLGRLNVTSGLGQPLRAELEVTSVGRDELPTLQVRYRMTVDRRRNQELRDAFDVLQNLARSVERYNTQQNSWNNVTRALAEVGREIRDGNTGPFPPDTGGGDRNGRIRWTGRVDDDVRITFRGNSADVETLGGTEYSDSQPQFANSLPFRRVTGETRRSDADEARPTSSNNLSRQNNFAVVVRIKDSRGGASDYEFDLIW